MRFVFYKMHVLCVPHFFLHTSGDMWLCAKSVSESIYHNMLEFQLMQQLNEDTPFFPSPPKYDLFTSWKTEGLLLGKWLECTLHSAIILTPLIFKGMKRKWKTHRYHMYWWQLDILDNLYWNEYGFSWCLFLNTILKCLVPF